MNPRTRVLIVDDETSFTHLLKLTLESTGRYVVSEENHGEFARSTAREFKPDIIFLDVVMPGTDGGDVAAQLRSDSELAEIPIIFLTAIVSQKEAERGAAIGGFPFLAKPVSFETIESCIDRYTTPAAARPR